jgi:uncharacterized protein with ParB-like and HNH nuclease domain
MKNQKQTIRKIVGFLNNPDDDGGFWLPNIQRPFVWSEDQICRLFDSILREYPISTLLVWRTKSNIRRRKFIDNWNSNLRLSDFFVPEDNKKKSLILDGQQRLQSLFIGLRGSFESRVLCLDILSGEIAAPDDIKYRFEFRDAANLSFPWVKFTDLVFTTKRKRELADEISANAHRLLTTSEIEKIVDHIDLIDRTIKTEEIITYQELDSIDNPNLYTEDDVVEIFIRANSGGTKLGKSDLLFSLLSAYWEFADKNLEDLLISLNSHGFLFDRDFVLKTCLILLNKGARYEVSKFRAGGVREEIESKWDSISKSIKDVLDFVRGKTFIQCDKALPSYLTLMPLVYLRFHFPEIWKKSIGLDEYLLRCSLTGAFSGQSDRLLDALVKLIREKSQLPIEDAVGVIQSQGRNLALTEDRFWLIGYGSDSIHLLFNLWYRGFNHTPAYDNNLPQIDHIFPQSALRSIKVTNPESGRDVMKYLAKDRDQLANCMLLTREENGSGGKSDKLPKDWFKGKDKEYLKMHLIPENPDLWEMDHFEDFIAARKVLIKDKFKLLISK